MSANFNNPLPVKKSEPPPADHEGQHDLEELERKLKAATGKISNLRRDNTALEKSSSEARQLNRRYGRHAVQCEKIAQTYQEDLKGTKQRYEGRERAFTETVVTLEATITERDLKIFRQIRSGNEKDTTISDLQKELAKAQQVLQTQQSEHANHGRFLEDGWRSQLEKAKREMAAARSDAENLRAQLVEAQGNVKEDLARVFIGELPAGMTGTSVASVPVGMPSGMTRASVASTTAPVGVPPVVTSFPVSSAYSPVFPPRTLSVAQVTMKHHMEDPDPSPRPQKQLNTGPVLSQQSPAPGAFPFARGSQQQPMKPSLPYDGYGKSYFIPEQPRGAIPNAPVTLASQTTRPSVTARNVACKHCVAQFWDASCSGDPCGNCALSNETCKRPKCEHYDNPLDCAKGAGCTLAHSTDGWTDTWTHSKRPWRAIGKTEAVIAPVLRPAPFVPVVAPKTG